MDTLTSHIDFELLASKYFSGEASKAEKAHLLSAINEDPGLKILFHSMHDSYSGAKSTNIEHNSADAFAHFKTVTGMSAPLAKTVVLHSNTQNKLRNWGWVAAAVVAVFVSITSIALLQKQEVMMIESDLALVESTISDGSVITLNEFSKISYPETFEQTRAIALNGQAFFEVTPNKEKPFVVSVGGVTVTVLGTAFDIASYPDSDSISVVVSHGRVQVATISDTVILEKGDRADFSKSNSTLVESKNIDQNFLAWKTKKLQFNGTSLRQVCADLQRYYKTPIIVENDDICDCKLTATYDNYPLDLTLEMLQTTFNIDVEQQDGSYIISGEKCNF